MHSVRLGKEIAVELLTRLVQQMIKSAWKSGRIELVASAKRLGEVLVQVYILQEILFLESLVGLGQGPSKGRPWKTRGHYRCQSPKASPSALHVRFNSTGSFDRLLVYLLLVCKLNAKSRSGPRRGDVGAE